MTQRSGKAPAKYKQIAADLRVRIEGGEWLVDAQLPTEPELAVQYGAAVGTVSKALKLLEDLRMTETLQGSGTFVRSPQAVEAAGPEDVRKLVSEFEDVRQQLGKVEERLAALEAQRPQ